MCMVPLGRSLLLDRGSETRRLMRFTQPSSAVSSERHRTSHRRSQELRAHHDSCTGCQSADEWISRYPPTSIVRWLIRSCVYLTDECTLVTAIAAVLCGLLTIEHALSRSHATSSVTAVLPPPGQPFGTVCLNSFGNRTSPSGNSNDR